MNISLTCYQKEGKGIRKIESCNGDTRTGVSPYYKTESPGPDGIYQRVIKDLKAGTVDLLTEICNLFLLLASVVENWKLANVTPIFKNGSWGKSRKF